ncbi:MAG: hypothetical protein QOC83_5910, partial [Pseudonocardiales bacterium]|nr:hypothetical protein [Pseudonocardiales bacterium]
YRMPGSYERSGTAGTSDALSMSDATSRN